MRNKKIASILFLIIVANISLTNSVVAVSFPETKATAIESLSTVGILYKSSGTEFNGEFSCTGSLISPTQVLTAAHCVHGLNPYNLVVTAPTGDVIEDYVDLEPVVDFIENPRYLANGEDSFGVNDVAILEIKNPFKKFKTVLFAKTSLEKKLLKSNMYLLGYGEDQNGNVNGPLMKTRQANYSSKGYSYSRNFNSSTQIAAGLYNSTEDTFSGACPGDSGGPLLSKTSAGVYLLGVVSYGAADCSTASPTFYMRASYYLDWIVTNSKVLKQRKSTKYIIFGGSDTENDVDSSSINNDIVLAGGAIYSDHIEIETFMTKKASAYTRLSINLDTDLDGNYDYYSKGDDLYSLAGQKACSFSRSLLKDSEGALLHLISLKNTCFGDPKYISIYYLQSIDECLNAKLIECIISGKTDYFLVSTLILK